MVQSFNTFKELENFFVNLAQKPTVVDNGENQNEEIMCQIKDTGDVYSISQEKETMVLLYKTLFDIK